MTFRTFYIVTLAALIFTLALIFVGAVVRATGAGMGCPDWPTCWGKIIPPTKKSQIDTSILPIEKYQKKALRHGRNPNEITRETILNEFNPVHTWTEFINRICSIPIGVFSLLSAFFSWWFSRKKPWLTVGANFALFLVLLNAWMGAKIVYSGLKPGVITLHMALAILLICTQVCLLWFTPQERRRWTFSACDKKKLLYLSSALFLCILIEGIFGSQVRELTDALKKSHHNAPRIEWVGELEKSSTYLFHRSFSWLILIGGGALFLLTRPYKQYRWNLFLITGCILAQMILGISLSLFGISILAQILHIGLSAILVASFCYWLLELNHATSIENDPS